jgi:hypothetical protein
MSTNKSLLSVTYTHTTISPPNKNEHTQEPEPEKDEAGGDGGAFDFEAHMARLIERSERSMGFAPARGWEEGELERLERVRVLCVCWGSFVAFWGCGAVLSGLVSVGDSCVCVDVTRVIAGGIDYWF